jgi:hypothetical protein
MLACQRRERARSLCLILPWKSSPAPDIQYASRVMGSAEVHVPCLTRDTIEELIWAVCPSPCLTIISHVRENICGLGEFMFHWNPPLARAIVVIVIDLNSAHRGANLPFIEFRLRCQAAQRFKKTAIFGRSKHFKIAILTSGRAP